MNDFKGKKLLILSGTAPHVKVVQKAKEMGIYTIVADYFEPSNAAPAKLISDENWNISLLDIDELIEKAQEASVDGVVAAWSDLAQIPYAKICDALSLHSYGSLEQFDIMSNKARFKDLCRKNGIGTIPEYSLEDVLHAKISFPVVTKPVDGRSSKGISVCNNYEELDAGIEFAKNNSLTERILIEKYIGEKNSFQVNYLFVDGEAYVLRTADGYKGMIDEKLDRVALCSVSPSVYTEEFFKNVNDKFVKMMHSIGFQNGPVMAQGFYDDGVFRFYDPGLRFPGVDYDELYKSIYGVDLTEIMIIFALTGSMPQIKLSNENVLIEGNKACILYPTVGAGTISEIKGIETIQNDPSIFVCETRYDIGDRVEWTFTTRQRLAEIVFIQNDESNLIEKIKSIQQCISVFDEYGNNMVYKPFDVKRLLNAQEG